MPEIAKEFTVRASLEDTWALVSDMERFSLCIPGCKKVTRISDTEFDWDLEAKVLRTTRKAQARTRAVVMQPPTNAEFVGEGRLFERSNHYKLTINGTTVLEPVSADRTKVKFAGLVKASGLGGAIVEKVAAGQMDGLFQEFESNIRQTLGDDGEAAVVDESADAAAPPAPASIPKSDSKRKLVIAAAGAAALLALAYYLLS
jgi:carbon monoxide dehydrogenase subunit G